MNYCKGVEQINLPELTAKIGKKQGKKDDPLYSLVKPLKYKLKPNDEPYAVFLRFDLLHKNIKIELPQPFSDHLRFKYNYFGNNNAASSQCYLVREGDSLRYLLCSVLNDLVLTLTQFGLQENDLCQLIKKIELAGLITLGTKKGEGSINLERFVLPQQPLPDNIVVEKKHIVLGDKKINYQQLIHIALGSVNKAHCFVLVIPSVILNDGSERILSTHPDYLDLVKKVNKINELSADEVSFKTTRRICYVCHQMKPDVSSKYSTKFNRAGVNKIFTTKTINSAKSIKKDGYDDVYSICNSCYQDLLSGEAIIQQQFRGRIAGESAFMLPEGILGGFWYDKSLKLKDGIDFAFKCKDASDWINMVESDTVFWEEQKYYSVNFIIYRSDGKSLSILETIEDIPTLRFAKVMEQLKENMLRLQPHLKWMSLSSIYRIIPVRETKDGTQVDVGRVLTLYKVLLSGGQVNKNTLFEYLSDALDKGMRQLSKDKLDNYKNMALYKYVSDKEDFFIKNLVMSYLGLFQTCQQLGLLDKDIFNPEAGEESNMGELEKPSQNQGDQSISEMEVFLREQKFMRQAKALFYLGALVNRVSIAQYHHEHKTKPILRKITFQGMTDRDILRLYEGVVEKLHQYKKLTYFSGRLMNKFHEYYGSLEEKWPLNEHANIFYLMAGYAYMVGKRPPDLSTEEAKIIEEIESEVNEEE